MSDEIHIVTNHIPRDVLYGWDLSPAERAEFDYIDWPAIERGEDSASFFRYRGTVYDLGEFTITDNVQPLAGYWHAYQSDSFFSGIVIRMTEDYERVIVGRYWS